MLLPRYNLVGRLGMEVNRIKAALMSGQRAWAILALIVLGSGYLASLTLTRGHNWGDDFAGYLLQAESIVNGNMDEFLQHSRFTAEQSSSGVVPDSAPWGLPTLLAPIYAVFGLKLLALKVPLTASYLAFLVALFALARTRLTEFQSLLVTAAMAFSPRMLQAQNEILSDLPFLALSTISLFLIDRYRNGPLQARKSAVSGAVIGLVIFAASFMRGQGMLLLVPLAAAQLQMVRGHRRPDARVYRLLVTAGIPYVVFALLYLSQSLIFPSTSIVRLDPLVEQRLRWSNLPGYLWLPSAFLEDFGAASGVLYVGMAVFFMMSLLAHGWRDAPLHLYILAILAVQIRHPAAPQPRYLYPVWPLFLILCLDGMAVAIGKMAPHRQKLATILLHAYWLVIAAVALVLAIHYGGINVSAGRNPGRGGEGAFTPSSLEMFDFVRSHTPPDSVVIFYKPRAMRLLTHRDSFFTTDCADLPKADYVVLRKDGGTYNQISPSRIASCNPSAQLARVYGKGAFEVFSIGLRH